MFNHRLDEAPDDRVVLHWFMLSLNGGFINAGGFLATGRFVSHVTGFATLFGVDIAHEQSRSALGMLSVPIFFLLGAFLAGLLIDRALHLGKRPHIEWVMGLAALCLFGVALGGELLHFGHLRPELELGRSYIFLALLCLSCGLQNGAITSSSGHSVRTTHLTGLTTDLGLGLSRVLTFDLKQIPRQRETRANYLRLGSILSFIFGSALGAWAFMRWGYVAFAFPGLIATYSAWHGRGARPALHHGS